MSIQVNDVKLLASERLTDTDDGGGRMTGQVIESGVLNNLFPDISRLDRTYGRLGLRKAYMAVVSQDTDTYLGSHVIVTDPPDDDRVAVTMFTTGSVSDVRSDAQDRIESYVTVGPLSYYYLFGNQPKGAKAITLLGRVEAPLPDVGDVLVLSVENGATVTAQQYVRIADVAAENRTFTDEQGDFNRKVLTLTLTAALRQTFIGAEASRLSVVASATRVRQTTVADASTYFGVSRLAQPAVKNALEINVSSITSQLVPATTRETAIAGASPGLSLSYIAAGTARALTAGNSPTFQYRGILPRSMSVQGPSGTAVDSDGSLVVGGTTVGTVDYEAGRTSGTQIYGGTYIPAAATSAASHTFAIDVTLANQGTVYVVTLPSRPAPGTMSAAFRFLGKWYTIRDAAGDGSLAGSSATEGGGTVDYTTGNATLTLGAVPDAGSKIVFSWGDPTSYQAYSGADLAIDLPTVTFQLAGFPIKRGTLVLKWLSAGTAKTAAAAEDGTISGDATGTVVYLNGLVILRPKANALPDSNAKIDAVYTQSDGQSGSLTAAYAAGSIAFDFPGSTLPLKPGTVGGSLGGFAANRGATLYFKDDGAGNLVTAYELAPKTEGLTLEQIIAQPPIITVNAGSIDYTTGHAVIQPGSMSTREFKVKDTLPGNRDIVLGDWMLVSALANFVPAPIVRYKTQRNSAGETPAEESSTFPGVKFVLTRDVVDPIVAGSVWFSWGGREYIDRQGKIFRDMDSTTGSAIEAGSIDYTTGAVTLSNYGTTSGGPVTVRSLLTRYGDTPVSYVAFRTPGAPLRPSTFAVQAVRTDTGDLITATSNPNGDISGPFIGGKVENDLGFAAVKFGYYVPAAGNETQPWYSAENVVGSNVWKPVLVDPSTVKFNCVVQTTLPLNADILGIDPVRLPLTGRVPIFRDGDVIVLHESRPATWPSAVQAGQVVTLAGGPFGQVVLFDTNGAEVPDTFYTVEVETGRVTMGASVAGLLQPLTAQVSLEDMLLVSSVDLSGRLALGAPLSRDYTTAALVSSALIFGDLQAQNPIFFSQQTWQNVWSDALSGSGTTAQYNRTLYPLSIVNANATTERFALIFQGATSGVIVGETLGQIGVFNTNADVAPVNPLTGKPYFTLLKGGWGSGWGVNNVLRINTVGPNAPIWLARTVLPGAQATSGDSFRLQLRGDAA